MVRLCVVALLLLAYNARPATAQTYPDAWFEAVVGSPQSRAPVMPNAQQYSSVSAVRSLGDVSVTVNTPQVRARRVFRALRQDEAPYEYIKEAVQEAARDKLHLTIPRGVYSVRIPERARAAAHVELRAVDDVRLDFQGSTLIFHDVNRSGFLLTDTRRVTIANATMWWSGMSHVMGTVEGGPGDLRVKIHPDYLPHVDESPMLQQKIHAILPARIDLPHLWDFQNYNYEYHSPSTQSEFTYSRERGSYIPKRPDILAPFRPGQSVLVQNKKFGANAFHLIGGSDLTVSGCTIGHTPGMGLFSPSFERGLAWIHNTIAPVSHPLHVTTTADGVHLRNIGGDFVIQGSTFERTTDDPINVYGGLMEVVSVESATTFHVEARHIQADLKLLNPGQEVFFVDGRIWPRGRAIIQSVEPLAKGLLRITTSRALPSVKPGHSAFTRESIPRRGIVMNNVVAGVRARAGLVLQAVSVSAVANTIHHTTGPAIISGAFQNWYVEGPLAANVRIRDNMISSVGLAPFYARFNLRGAISVGTGTKDPPDRQTQEGFRAHWGIAIVRNRISDSIAPAIQVQDARTVWIRENSVSRSRSGARDKPLSFEALDVCDLHATANSLDGDARMESQACP